ncbi:hypothetical protein HJC23_005512 [Cyclotella cryptica]|uniref:Nudix hydrolase domain-containing protein n=1 Tax=Cyclotella cryptica TaxID=29204 RepID=A0ABD3NPX3_9STRA|eukprot:CCRYP_020279-RA/>CCRYP_020279-RA protein AED:0.29 eAED:0.29 QI:213/1/1/1/1/1/2/235/223
MSSSDTNNPHALDEAQNPDELFEIMNPPSVNFDPYSDRPISTNSFSTRADAHQRCLWHCSVHIWIIKSPSSILLQRRSMKKDTFPGRWDISSAGHIEAGKSPLDAAYCEIAEELGIDLRAMGEDDKHKMWNGGLRHAFIIPAEQAPIGGCNAFEFVYFLILSNDSSPKLSLGTEEVMDVSWMDAWEVIQALRSRNDEFAPRTKDYIDAMEKCIQTFFNKEREV